MAIGSTAMASGGVNKKRPHKYIGGGTAASSGLRKSKKMHGSPLEAFNRMV
jgi:hypothetical protein